MSSTLHRLPSRLALRSISSNLRHGPRRLIHLQAPTVGTLPRRYGPRSFQVAPYNPSLQQWRHYADTITVKVPPMAESISEGTLKQWLKEVGDEVEQDEEIATIETDKVDVAVNAPGSGILTELLAEADTTVVVGQDLAKLEVGAKKEGSKSAQTSKKEEAQSDPEPTKNTEESKPSEKPTSDSHPPRSAQQDSKTPSPKPSASTPSSASPSASIQGLANRAEQRVKMTRIRLRTAERLKQSQNTAASLTTFNEVDMSAVVDLRARYKGPILEKTGIKLGFMSFFTRACILAMKDVPVINAGIEGPDGGDTIVYRDYVDVSIAVATERGLVTPVIRNAETLDILSIDKMITELGNKARTGKLNLEDLAGGTFTISNGGVFGSLMGTPIINLPQSAVLGLHATKERPVVVNGKIEIRPMMYLALTYDHRILDGREAVTFLVKVKEYIEDPTQMLLLPS